MLELAAFATENPGKTVPLELVFTIQEERGLRGSRFFDPTRLKAKDGILLDSEEEIGGAVSAQPTSYQFVITVHGKASHAAVSPEKGINAIKALGDIIHALPTGKIGEDTVMNLGKVEGGGPTNVVPDLAVLTGMIRSLDAGRLDETMAMVRKTAEKKLPPMERRPALRPS